MTGELAAAGVDPLDERIYRLLLTRTSASADDLATEAAASIDHVSTALARLHDQGFVGLLAGEPRRYAAIEPSSAVETLIRDRERELEQVRVAARSLTELYRSGAATKTDEVEFVHGPEALGRRFVQLQQEAREEILALDRPPYALATENPVEEQALARGVGFRVVYAPEAVADPIISADINRLVELGEDARLLPDLPVKLAIADRSTALMPLSLEIGDGVRAAVIHESSLLDALVDYWEQIWRLAIPFGAQPTAELNDDDQALLTLLATGLKDEAIARQLGWSLRTMRRRVHRLHEITGTTNRFQAGVVAIRRGWL